MPAPNANYNSLASEVVDVKRDFAAQGDGISDDTIPIQNAIAAASTNFGGGTVYFPPGVYLTGTQLLPSKVQLRGAGMEATILKLKNGANADLLQGSVAGYGGGVICNVGAANASGSTGGIYNWGIHDLTLDGNKANQSSGTSYCCRVYGFGYVIENVRMRNGYSGGMLSDWNGGSGPTVPAIDNMEAHFANCKFHDNNAMNFEIGGPHDSSFINCEFFNSGTHGMHIAPNATALKFTNCHVYGLPGGQSAVGWLVEAGYTLMYNCESEISDTMSIALIASECIWHGHVFGVSNASPTQGMQLGQAAGNTPYPGQVNQAAGVTTAVQCGGCVIEGIFDYCALSHGAIWFANSSGGNHIRATCFQNAGNVLTGTIHNQDQFWISQKGLTADGTLGKSGGLQLASSANQGILMYDNAGNQFFAANARNAKFLIGNGGQIGWFSDAFFSTQQGSINCANGDIQTNGWIASGPSATAPDPGANGTVSTANVGVAQVTPAANRAGCILQAGTQVGQEVWVVNESGANTISWATQATSNISGEAGGTFVLAAKSAQKFVWINSLWYKTS